MKEFVTLVVVLPVGPGDHPGVVAGALESVGRWTSRCRKVLVVAGAQRETAIPLPAPFAAPFPAPFREIEVIPAPAPITNGRTRYAAIARAVAHAAGRYQFKTLLCLDADALVIGPNPEIDALRLFRDRHEIGMVAVRPAFAVDRAGTDAWPRSAILAHLGQWRTWVGQPAAVSALRRVAARAAARGCEPTEELFGGAYFLSEACVHEIAGAGLLTDERLGRAGLPDDHLFALLANAVGKGVAYLPADIPRFACAWRSLRDAPLPCPETSVRTDAGACPLPAEPSTSPA